MWVGGNPVFAKQNNRVSVLLLQSVADTAAAGLLIASHLLHKGRPGMKKQPKAFTKVGFLSCQCNVTSGKAIWHKICLHLCQPQTLHVYTQPLQYVIPPAAPAPVKDYEKGLFFNTPLILPDICFR